MRGEAIKAKYIFRMNNSKVQEDKPRDKDPDGIKGSQQHSETAGHREVPIDQLIHLDRATHIY